MTDPNAMGWGVARPCPHCKKAAARNPANGKISRHNLPIGTPGKDGYPATPQKGKPCPASLTVG